VICVTYYVTCDLSHPDDPDDVCEAEFEHVQTGTGDTTALVRQLHARGWTYEHGRFRCPLHDRKAAHVSEAS